MNSRFGINPPDYDDPEEEARYSLSDEEIDGEALPAKNPYKARPEPEPTLDDNQEVPF